MIRKTYTCLRKQIHLKGVVFLPDFSFGFRNTEQANSSEGPLNFFQGSSFGFRDPKCHKHYGKSSH